jgi:hypothetical protein
MGYNKAAGDKVSATEFNNFLSSAGLYAASSAGSDAYAITVSPVPNDYDAGDTYTFKADVANTGACTLNVNSLGAKTIKKYGTLDLSTGDIIAGQMVTVRYDGTYFQMESVARPTPFYQQQLPVGAEITGNVISGSSSDGSVLYIHDTGSDTLRRYERQSLTGMYFKTHEVSVTEPSGAWTLGSIVEVGSYIYVLVDTSGANMEGFRFDKADLTNQTTLTIPSVASVTAVTAWTDETYIYVISESSNTTSRKWSISGTTLSAVSTATVSSGLTESTGSSSFWDGTNAWLVRRTSGTDFRITKLTAIDGTSYSDTNIDYTEFTDTSDSSYFVSAIIDNTKIYVGHKFDNWNATNVEHSHIMLYPVNKP